MGKNRGGIVNRRAEQVEACLKELSWSSRQEIEHMVDCLTVSVRNMGRKSALELVLSLAVFLDDHR